MRLLLPPRSRFFRYYPPRFSLHFVSDYRIVRRRFDLDSEFIVGIDLGTTNCALSYWAAVGDEGGQITGEKSRSSQIRMKLPTARCCPHSFMSRMNSIFLREVSACHGMTRRSSSSASWPANAELKILRGWLRRRSHGCRTLR